MRANTSILLVRVTITVNNRNIGGSREVISITKLSNNLDSVHDNRHVKTVIEQKSGKQVRWSERCERSAERVLLQKIVEVGP